MAADDWREVLQDEGWYTGEDGSLAGDEDPWLHASAGQLLDLCKLLGLEQQSIANFLQVNKTAISLWINHHRPTPDKYRDRLLAYTKMALQRALNQKAKEVLTLPPVMRDVAGLEFYAALRSWRVSVVHGKAIVSWLIRQQCAQLATLGTQEAWTPDERQTLLALSKGIQAQLRTLEEMETETSGLPHG